MLHTWSPAHGGLAGVYTDVNQALATTLVDLHALATTLVALANDWAESTVVASWAQNIGWCQLGVR